MTKIDKQYFLDSFSAKANEKLAFAANGFKRVEQHSDDLYSHLVDIHESNGIRIHYISVLSENAPKTINFPETADSTLIFPPYN